MSDLDYQFTFQSNVTDVQADLDQDLVTVARFESLSNISHSQPLIDDINSEHPEQVLSILQDYTLEASTLTPPSNKLCMRGEINGANKQILYVHVPKTGGTSLEKYLANSFNVLNVPPVCFHEHDLSKYDVIVSHVSRSLIDRTFAHGVWSKFIFFRDPKERIISDYYYLVSYHNQNMELLEFLQKPDGDFLQDYGHIKDNAYVRYLANKDPDNSLISDGDIEEALEYLETFDFIGFTETMNEDIKILKQMYCMDDVQITHEHQRQYSSRSTPIDKITSEMHDELARLTKYDYVVYKRAKEISSQKRKELFESGLNGRFGLCKN